jgi:hypothetical protein
MGSPSFGFVLRRSSADCCYGTRDAWLQFEGLRDRGFKVMR